MLTETEQLQIALLGFKYDLYRQGLDFDNEFVLELCKRALNVPGKLSKEQLDWMPRLVSSGLLTPEAVLPSQSIVKRLRDAGFDLELVEQIAEVVETGIL